MNPTPLSELISDEQIKELESLMVKEGKIKKVLPAVKPPHRRGQGIKKTR